MSEIQAVRNTLINKVATVTGFTLKKSAKSTGGLSMSNKDMVANGLAHLLCNKQNFATVNCLLDKWDEIKDGTFIHENWANKFDLASVLYACGTAPRIVSNINRHKSKDAAMKGGIDTQGFIAWAQAWRIKFTETGYVGMSRSVKVGNTGKIEIPILRYDTSKADVQLHYEDQMIMDDFEKLMEIIAYEDTLIKPENAEKLTEIKSAQEFQRNMHELLSVGGLAIDRVLKGKSLTDLRSELEKRATAAAARKTNKAETPAVEKVTPAVKKAANRGRSKGNAA